MNGHILIGDENQRLLDLLKKSLEEAGFNVLTVTTAEAAIEACESSAVDLAFLDVEIATVFGRACRSNSIAESGGTKVPFIVLSGPEEEEGTVSGALNRAALSALPKSVIEALACTQCLGSIVGTVVAQCAELRSLRLKLARTSNSGQTIDIATGIVMERYRVNARAAFGLLRDVSRRNRRKVFDVSMEILHSQELAAELRNDRTPVPEKHG